MWTGVFKKQTFQSLLSQDSTEKEYFNTTYKKFYRSISDMGADKEIFDNVHIIHDENIASVTFDYSFWQHQTKINWGKESWGLVKTNGQWKITSVIFSLEFENIIPESKPLKRDNLRLQK